MASFRKPLAALFLASIFLVVVPASTVHAYWAWDGFTKVTLGERGAQGPALAYDPALGKTIMAWVGINCCGHNLNLISSSDMRSWGNKVTLSQSASPAAACTDSLDMMYNPDNSRVYVAYLHVDTGVNGIGAACNTNYLNVFYTSDGTSVSADSLVYKTQFCSPTCGADNQMSGPTITYDTVNHRFVVANMVNQNVGGTIYHHYLTYTSTDGINWSGGQLVNVNPGPSLVRPEIRFYNGKYFLTYMANNGYVTIAQSSDLSSWTVISNTIQQTGTTPRLFYNPSEGLYHLDWRGTDSSNQINDAISPDGAVSWPSKNVFESSQDEPSLTWVSGSNTQLLAWTGTDCCIGGSLNVEQYRWIQPSCGCGGGGSVAKGTLITMADGSKLAVQNVAAGDEMLGYDPNTGKFTTSIVKAIWPVTTDNMLIIRADQGAPYRTDANPYQRLWVQRSDGSVLWLPVTMIAIGDKLFTPDGWATVSSIDYIPSGQYTMYDIIATMPYFANGYLDPIYKV